MDCVRYLYVVRLITCNCGVMDKRCVTDSLALGQVRARSYIKPWLDGIRG